MAIQDDTTANRGYSEPYKDNFLADDVARLRSAIAKIDQDVAELFQTFAGLAPLLSPAFTGEPSAPTPAQSDQTSKIATTAFVAQALQGINTSGLAPIDSPQFKGGPTVPTAAAGDASALIASTAFVALALQQLLGSPPDTLNSLGELAAAINNDPNFYQTIAATLNDPWATLPIGVPVPIYDNLVSAPGSDKAYRFIRLTAADSYNGGLMGSESVSGAAPTISATGVITLANSPLVGKTVRLINTEGRFIRPGATGTLQDSQNLSHTHGYSDPSHAHSSFGPWGPGPLQHDSSDEGDRGVNNGSYTTTTSYNGIGISIQAAGGNEARPRNMAFNHYMRIR